MTRARRQRWAQLCAINLRILVGFAFVPAGLKKVLYQPFTDPSNTGAFHEFLHAFYATGPFYQFVGLTQLIAAVLLMTQRFAALGALLATPIIVTITVFCWSTKVYPTAVVVSLITLAVLGLLVWDARPWRDTLPSTPIDMRLWEACGLAILTLYLAVCAWSGGIYRPRGVELDNPAFYVFPAMAALPLITLIVSARRAARRDHAV